MTLSYVIGVWMVKMMKCKNVQKDLNEYIDGTVSEADAAQIEDHIAGCTDCSSELDRSYRLKESLMSLPVPRATAGFERRVIQTAIADGQSSLGDTRLFKTAAVAALFVLVVALGLFVGDVSEHSSPYQFAVGNDVRTVTIAIDSTRSLDSVNMRVELSDNLELKGFGDKRSIRWTTGLREGANIISLPIIGIAQGEGEITTRVILDGKEKVMRVNTYFKNPGNVQVDSLHLHG